MKNKIYFSFILLLLSLKLFSQEEKKSLPFVLLINDEVVESGIYDGAFIAKDSSGIVKYEFPFIYHVGRLDLSKEDYRKFFTLNSIVTLFFKFKYKNDLTNYNEMSYEGLIPVHWRNDEYTICHIYDVSKAENKMKYDFGGKKYIVKITIPASTYLLRTWDKSVDKKSRMNQH